MKKILLIGILGLIYSAAQSQAKVAIGIKGGLNFANVNTSSVGAAYNSRTGYHLGAFTLIKFSKIGIQPEIVFSRQGSSISATGTSADWQYDYLNIPVILKLYTVAGINIQVGPQFGFLSSATQTLGGSTTDIKNNLKGSDISLAMGLGIDLPFGLLIDARYNLGLTDINNTAGLNAAKNQVIQVSAGFKLFSFGK
jgi:hypothetical protein